jgi:hypothetical protein
MTYAINQSFFSTWNSEMAYVLGFWFADGWMGQPGRDLHIGFVSKNREHLQCIKAVMASEQRLVGRKDGCYSFRIGNQQLWHDLYALGGRPAKSLIAEMPFIPQELVRHFVRGYIDGDGSLYWDMAQRRCPKLFIVGGEAFLEALSQIIDQEAGVGIAPVRVNVNHTKLSGKDTPRLTYSGIKAKVLAKWMYTSGNLMLERKALLAQEFMAWQLSKFGWKSQAVMTPRMREILVS